MLILTSGLSSLAPVLLVQSGVVQFRGPGLGSRRSFSKVKGWSENYGVADQNLKSKQNFRSFVMQGSLPTLVFYTFLFFSELHDIRKSCDGDICSTIFFGL